MAYLGAAEYNLELFSCEMTFAKLHPSSKSPKIYNATEDMRTYTHHRGNGIHYES